MAVCAGGATAGSAGAAAPAAGKSLEAKASKGAPRAKAGAAARAQDVAQASLKRAPDGAVGWDESAGLEIAKGDSVDSGARIFDSPDYKQQLVIPSAFAATYLLELKTKTLRVISPGAIAWTDDDKPFPDVSAATDAGSFTADAGVVEFQADSIDWQIRPEPPLVGHVSLEELKEQKPEYVYAAVRYHPDPAAVALLKGVDTETHIAVFFGTWCTYCKHWLPRFLRTLDEVDNPKITADFYGMSEDQKEPADAIARYRISLTPTFVVLRGEKELGRIEENPKDSIESDLAAILGGR
jgi:thiol-disulfide isomerase/thioredoxin